MTSSFKRRDFLKTATVATVSANLVNAQESPRKEGAASGQPLEIVVYLYPGMTALDAIGTYEVLRGIPNSTIRFAAKERGLVRMDSQVLSLNADFAIRDINAAGILVLPGGLTTPAQLQDKELLAWVRQIHEKSKWTTSVCTGSLILAAAGLLKGLEATTHWLAMDALKMFGAKPTHQRVVQQGKIITAAGVSSGIDMALTPGSTAQPSDSQGVNAPNLQVFVFALFFIFGGITSLNDVIIPKLKELFTLNYFQALLVQSAFFAAYVLFSLPAAAVVRRIGYLRTAAFGLVTMTAGCLLFVPASSSGLFEVFLLALFVLKPWRAQWFGHSVSGAPIAAPAESNRGVHREVAANARVFER